MSCFDPYDCLDNCGSICVTTSSSPIGNGYMYYPYPPVYPTVTIIEQPMKLDPPVIKKLPEGVEMKKLYEVYLVYGENRYAPIIHREQVIADNEEDAKIKSGLHSKVMASWDSDYLTFRAIEIMDIKVKEKPKEVKQV